MTVRLAMGLMSGTSLDGVDAALVEVEGIVPEVRLRRVVEAITVPFETGLRQEIREAVRRRAFGAERLCLLNVRLGQALAEAALDVMRRTGTASRDLAVIGSHGQTLWHAPGQGATLQIGEPAVIAERTGVTVVADFRPADLAAGGQGAPLVPFVDYLLLRDGYRHRAVQNIGGIANVTYLPAGAAIEQVMAFDTGPGNMIIDALVRRYTRGRQLYDADGRLARRGKVCGALLDRLMAHPFLAQAPPKSTGREAFGQEFTDRLVADSAMPLPDLIATATAFTARSIAEAYRRWLPGPVDEVLVCGGGAHNAFLMERLALELDGVPIRKTDEAGLPADSKEAVAFAVLALAAVDGWPSNVPSATGAAGPRVLGKVCRPWR